MLKGNGLTVKVGSRTLLDSATIEIRPGTLTAVLGANGAGKSTLLKTLAGEIIPAAGEVTLDGTAITGHATEAVARRRAVLRQDSSLSADFTAMEVVLLGRTPYFRAAPSAVDRRIAMETSRTANVAHLAERRYPTLSGGERQRVHLARVLAQVGTPGAEASYLLLDEPTSSLDLAHQYLALESVRRFADQGGGVLAILHDLNLAAQHADHIVVMKNGRIVAYGEPAGALTPETIELAFGVRAVVQPHPTHDRPLIVTIDYIPTGPAAASAERESPRRAAGVFPMELSLHQRTT